MGIQSDEKVTHKMTKKWHIKWQKSDEQDKESVGDWEVSPKIFLR